MVEDYSAYIGHNNPPENELPEIVKLAEEQVRAEEKVALKTTELETATKELADIAEKRLPELMDSLGLETYGTKTGISVEVVEKVRGGLPAENRPRGHDWLDKNDFGALLKSQVVIIFGRSQLEKAKELVEQLRAQGLPANLERSVHHSTLDAFIREQLEAGKEIPLDIFSVYRQRIAKVEV